MFSSLASNRLKSVGEGEVGGGVCYCGVPFGYGLFCVLSLFTVIARSLLSVVGPPVSLSPTFSFVAASPHVLERSEVGGWSVSGWSFPGSELSVA